MTKNDRSRASKSKSLCRTPQGMATVQPIPNGGHLGNNLDLPLPVLTARIGRLENKAYSYVVKSVKLEYETTAFEQHGSAPNFQGDVLTLCTCKHRMRASQAAENWAGAWLLGFTSRTMHQGKHWLFYLARIDSAYASHADLWANLKPATRNAKAAHRHFLGDVFQPKRPVPTDDDRFSPDHYVSPQLHAHRRHDNDGWQDEDGWHESWHNDIRYRRAKRRQPSLLVADPRKTFLWQEPMIYLAENHSRDYQKWSSLQELMSKLREITQ